MNVVYRIRIFHILYKHISHKLIMSLWKVSQTDRQFIFPSKAIRSYQRFPRVIWWTTINVLNVYKSKHSQFIFISSYLFLCSLFNYLIKWWSGFYPLVNIVKIKINLYIWTLCSHCIVFFVKKKLNIITREKNVIECDIRHE